MNRLRERLEPAFLALTVLLPLGALQADEVDGLINALKPSPLDYAVWAGNLLKAVGDVKDNPKAQARLRQKAYEYGIKEAKGYQTAIQAARALLEGGPEQKAAWQQKLLVAYKLDWQAADRKRKMQAGRAYVEQMIAVADDLGASGDSSEAVKLYKDASYKARYYAPDRTAEIARKLKDIRDRQKLQQQVMQCRQSLAADPKNVAVRERLLRLYLVELDNAAEAAKFLSADVSQVLRTYVPLAAKPVDQLAKEACLELGDWYRLLSAEATARGKANALIRAKACYERSLSLEADSVKTAIIKARLAQVEKELRDRLGAPVVAKPHPQDPFMGEYVGTMSPRGRAAVKARGYVIPYAGRTARERTYRVVVRVASGKGREVTAVQFDGAPAGQKVVLTAGTGSAGWQGVIEKGRLTAANVATGGMVNLSFTVRTSPTEGQKPPAGAIVLLSFQPGRPPSLRHWTSKNWVRLSDGSVAASGGGTKTLRSFGSFRMHLEFLCPYQPDKKGQERGNSGVFLPNGSEIQVLDSFGLEPSSADCGAVYKIAAPRVAASLPPGCWQTYDIDYLAARGARPPVVTVRHNGVLIHKDLVLRRGPRRRAGETAGRISLQEHGSKVRYRNVWLVEPRN